MTAIGLELDETRVRAVALDTDGHVRARADAAVSGRLESAAESVLREVGHPSGGVPVGVAAPLPDAEAVQAALTALRAGGAPFGAAVTASGVAAAVAEGWIGAAKGVRDFVFFAVDDRTSAGVVRAGVPVSGARGRAASIAWLALNPVEREDYRKVGCLEAEVAASGIVRRLIWRIKAGDRSRVQDAVGDDLAGITVPMILEAARGGDGVSISVMRDTSKYLGMAAANLVVIVDPEMLVLGGIMATAADLLLESVRTELGRRLPRSILDALAIQPAALGPDAAAIGAARLASAIRP